MGPTTYALCQKPVIGVVMLITSLCTFPPLFSNEPFPLSQAGTNISKAFTVPVDKDYRFELGFEFPSVEARLSDQIVGSGFDANCTRDVKYQDIPEAQRLGLGRPMSFHVVIRRATDRTVFIDRTFDSRCVTSFVENKKWRTIGWAELPRGNYIAEVTNLESQRDLININTHISLIAGTGKWP